jgi:CIC family chloride channel protein
MKLPVFKSLDKLTSLRREFDIRLAMRWLILGSIVGIVSGLGAILFQTLLGLVKEFAMVHLMGLQPSGPGGEYHNPIFSLGNYKPYLVIIIPALGGLIAGFIVYRFAPEAEGHGTDEAIKSYHRKQGIISPKVPIVKLLASAITIGTGGSGGREGPIAQIGAGFGSFLATKLKLDLKTRRWLLAAGMGAGIGSIFRAPLAGAIFSAEVLYSSMEIETEVLLPATVSSIIAYSIYSFKYGWAHIFTNAGQFGFSNPLELLPYTIEALFLAFAAFVFVKSFYGVRTLFTNLKIPKYLKPCLGGLITGTFVFILIRITGDKKYVIDIMDGGYGILQDIFHNGVNQIGFWLLLLVGAGKIISTSSTIGSGGSAGVFGPSMVIGGTLGAASSYILQFVFPGITLHPSTFAIVGMAGFFAAAAKTPLSTIIMVSELTGNYELLLPSMWVCAISYLLARRWSIYQSQVPGKFHSEAHFGEYAHDIFETITSQDAFNKTRRFAIIDKSTTVNEILNISGNTRQRVFPVVDENKQLAGTFRRTDITQLLQNSNDKIKNAGDLMTTTILSVHPYETIDFAQKLMLANQVDELLVVDETEKPFKILGIITTADIMMAYNRRLTEIRFGKLNE